MSFDAPYIVICGHGRSGSNRMLQAFDAHERTLCRNEPNGLVGSPFRALPQDLFPDDLGADFPDRLADAVRIGGMAHGARDYFDDDHKTYLRHGLLAKAAAWIEPGRRKRRIFSAIKPDFAREEWRIPGPRLGRDAQDIIFPVLKPGIMTGWWILSHPVHAGQKLIHAVRRPEPFVKSWLRRYVGKRDAAQVFAESLPSARRIAAQYGVETLQGDAVTESRLIESELWRWRYINEAVHVALGASDRYAASRYEVFLADPEAEMRRLYTFAGLKMSDAHAAKIRGMENRLFGGTRKQVKIETPLGPILDKVLAGSALPSDWLG
jgi:hypothetical protein